MTEADLRAERGDSGAEVAAAVAEHIVDVPDFPRPGVLFKDLTPLFAAPDGFRRAIDAIIAHHAAPDAASAGGSASADLAAASAGGSASAGLGFDVVAGIEARGFVIAAAVAYATGTGVVPVRKAGKLPRRTVAVSYELEYGSATLEVHADAFSPGQRVLVVDDVLATGGTAEATLDLVQQAGGTVAGFSVLLELAFLGGRRRLGPRAVHALLTV